VEDILMLKKYFVSHGGVMVCGFKRGREWWIKGSKNPNHDFLYRGSLAVGLM
jgi:hypothetical protein